VVVFAIVVLPVITGIEEKVCTPVKVLAASVLAMVADVVGNVMVVLSVPARVTELLQVKVLPAAIVKVLVPLAVMARLLIRVEVRLPVLELKVRAVLFLGCKDCVPDAVTKSGKHEVSAASFAVVIVSGTMLPVPSKLTPPIVRAVCNLGADTIVITGVVVGVATVALASADETSVTVPLPVAVANSNAVSPTFTLTTFSALAA